MFGIRKIVISNFKNIELGELDFSPNVNCISGNNGEGKTNLLEAIYYLSMTKSMSKNPDKFNICYNREGFALAGNYSMPNGLEERFALTYQKNNEKKVKKGEKFYEKITEHIGLLPIVSLSPSDTTLISEGGEERRKFINLLLSQTDRNYLLALMQYNRLLAQRNQYLKSEIIDETLLESFDLQLSPLATKIYQKRKSTIDALIPIFLKYYKILCSGKEDVSLEYSSIMAEGDFMDILAKAREKDLYFKYTTKGIQRDDLLLGLNEHKIRYSGSQGQQKSFAIALKFAQYELMKNLFGYPPILLLDDVFDKLDISRVENIIAMVAGEDFGQIFITDSNKVRMSKIVDKLTKNRKYFEVNNGNFREIL